MSKGIAIETILMLLMGILIVGVIVYLIYRYVTGTTLGKEQCRGIITSWCTLCNNYDPEWKTNGGPPQTEELKNCVHKYFWPSQFLEDPVRLCKGNNCFCRNFIEVTHALC